MSLAIRARPGDLKVISLISTGHCLSHMYQLALPTLFFLITIKEGFSIASLALLTSVFFVVSAIGQIIAGFLVDKFGARPILFLGFLLIALATAAFAFANSYQLMLVLSFLAGLGNISTDEALWHSSIHTLSKSNTIADYKIEKLVLSIKDILSIFAVVST